MAFGGLKGTLTGSVASVTNPTDATGSVAVAVGDLVFCTFAQQAALTATGVTDNLGNTYSAVNAGTDGGNVTARCFFSRVTVAGTLTTVSFAATASSNDASCIADVIEGPFATSPLDANPANTTDTTTPFTCPATGTLAQADEVVMAAIAIFDNVTVVATAPGVICGTVNRANGSSGQSRTVVSATTSVVPEFTASEKDSVQVTASFKKAAAGTYSITAAAGSFALTGFAAGVLVSRKLAAGSGSYSLTGTAAALKHTWKLPAGASSFALTGSAAGLKRGCNTVAGAGSYALIGAAASLKHTWKLPAGAGSYLLTGADASLIKAGQKILAAGAGSFALTGAPAVLRHGWALPAGAGSFVLTGSPATLKRGLKIPAGLGSYLLTGQPAALKKTTRLPTGAGSYVLTGSPAELKKFGVSGAILLAGL